MALTASNQEIQKEVKSSTVDAKTTTRHGFLFDTSETHFSYPFTINLANTFLSNGDVPQVTSIDQQYKKSEIDMLLTTAENQQECRGVRDGESRGAVLQELRLRAPAATTQANRFS